MNTSPPSLPAIVLTPRQTHRVLSGHLWIYRNEIERTEGDPAPGDVVEVRDTRRHLRGIGYYNPASQITVRLLSRQPRPIDAVFWRERLRSAIAYRRTSTPARSCQRLVNSESDLLPGLIVDQYGDHLVVQCTTMGMDRHQAAIVELLREELRPRVIIERNDVGVRTLEGLDQRHGVLVGESAGEMEATIGSARFAFNLLDPHKTGFYLDQQHNYEQVARHVAAGARVLDAFCHLGGFAVHAARAGAGQVIGIDSASASAAGAQRAAELSGVAAACEFRCANAFDALKQAQAAKERFDLIVLDPPSFTRTRAAVPGALRGYKEIHLRALLMLPPGGKLATFCCSHHVSARIFLDTILEAAADAGKTLRLEETLSASPDHPVLPGVPETEYLKGFVLSVIDE